MKNLSKGIVRIIPVVIVIAFSFSEAAQLSLTNGKWLQTSGELAPMQ